MNEQELDSVDLSAASGALSPEEGSSPLRRSNELKESSNHFPILMLKFGEGIRDIKLSSAP